MSIAFINAQFGGRLGSLRVRDGLIAAIDADPEPGDAVLDLRGDRLLPGLINSHDHLQLNNLPEHETPGLYRHVRDWIAEIDARRRTDPQFEAGICVARDERLLFGGIKNLLSGVTTVAHHDPLYPFLTRPGYPISVLRNYGWSHSLYIDGDQSVVGSYRATPSDWPWIVHAAEGRNEEAADEFERLDALGCLKPNSVLVHGIALDQRQRARLKACGSALIWCPSSNMRLFGRTAEVTDLVSAARVALGTDSRLSGARDLLDELQLAARLGGFDDGCLEGLVTHVSAALLRLADRGALRPGLRADLLVLPAETRLRDACRSKVRLVMIGGIARYGDAECVLRASTDTGWTRVLVDGAPKLLHADLSDLLASTSTREPGLELPRVTGRAA
ncbi:MAG TPA: amidohydrolase family protein [Steroidobacteraceae bacterium]|nr:amidohydrolase family protein [Steroidobacteraceae bacterium]